MKLGVAERMSMADRLWEESEGDFRTYAHLVGDERALEDLSEEMPKGRAPCFARREPGQKVRARARKVRYV